MQEVKLEKILNVMNSKQAKINLDAHGTGTEWIKDAHPVSKRGGNM